MSFEKGTRLGAFEIVELIGAGGMGAVYRARDTTLGRDVAIKVLPEEFTNDGARLARFEREAKLLASLNHPGIATLYGLETHEGVRFIVMELVGGETLAELVRRGPVPVDRARDLFIQIADALAAAHGRGIVHRDLKPANVIVGSDDRVKVLDFGLAKTLVDATPGEAASESPTRTRDTEVGTVLGTAPYMSPEQARGETVDARADVWAFGCCLFEALAGKRAFEGASGPEILAAVLEREPDLDALPDLPSATRFALRRSLTKSAASRVHSIADLRLLLEEPDEVGRATPTGLARMPALATALATLALAGGLGVLASRLAGARDPGEVGPGVVRFSIQRPAGELPRSSKSVAISPDGSTLAWTEKRNEQTTLYVRSLAESEPRAILRAESLITPFFSPDGEWVGFFSGGQLKRIPTQGGQPQTLADANSHTGAEWGRDGKIYFGDELGGISTIPETGGDPVSLTAPPIEMRHRWPSVLPGGKGVLYSEGHLQNWGGSRIFVKPTDAPAKLLIEGGTAPTYVRTGHLIYAKEGALMAAAFDLDRLAVVGTAVPVLDTVLQDRSSGAVQYSVSDDGSLLYAPGDYGEAEHVLVWVEPDGRETPLPFPARHYQQPRLSPGDRKLALRIGTSNQNIWVYDLDDGSATRLTFEGSNDFPVWSPEGARVAFQSLRNGRSQVYWRRIDGSEATQPLTFSDTYLAPQCFAPDGKLLLVEAKEQGRTDIVWRPPDGGELEPFLATEHFENSAMISPDGRFLAYRSDESGVYEIYVQTFPPTGAKWQVSTEGGNEPLWSRDGRRIFYRVGKKMMAVAVTTDPSFRYGPPMLLFEGEYTSTLPDRTNYDVASDGRFLMVRRSGRDEGSRELAVVLDWTRELSRRGSAH
jgi:serine/threonine protein kinase